MEAFPELQVLLLLMLAAFVAGTIDAIAGGGGLITLPALLSAGIPPHLALGTNKLAGTFGTFSAARLYVSRGLFRPRAWRAAIVATFVGAMLGALGTRLVSAPHLDKVLPLLIIAAALYVVIPKGIRPLDLSKEPRPAPRSSAVLGTVLGFYDGFAGPGTGAFWTTLAMKLYRVDILRASGIARFMNFVSNVVSLATFMLLGSVHYGVGLLLGSMVMLGAHIGARSAIRHGAPLIRPVFVAVVLALAVRLAWIGWMQ